MRQNAVMGTSWIENRLAERGKSKTALGKALGLPPPRVTELLNGKRQIQLDELMPMAKFLEMPVAAVMEIVHMDSEDLEKEHSPGSDPIYMEGVVEADVWFEEPEFPPPVPEFIFAPAPTEKYFGLYGLLVRGDSMNKIYMPGTILMVVPKSEYFDPYRSGLKVICRRWEDGRFETTVKELEIKDDRYWLWPRSDHPEHQRPIEISPPHSWRLTPDKGPEYNVIAVVVGSYRSELPE